MKKGFVDYIADSFRILFRNKILLFSGLMDALMGGFLLLITYNTAITGPGTGLFTFLIILIALGLVGAFLIAGKLNMIRKVYEMEYATPEDGELSTVEISDYFQGAKDFGVRIFGGSILLLVLVSVLFIPLLFILAMMNSLGLILLTGLGLAVALLFITLWDTILVADDTPITDAMGDSISFVKGNFLMVLGLNIFAGLISFDDTLSPNIELGAENYGQRPLIELPAMYQWMVSNLGAVSWPIILAAAVVFNVIAHMVFMDLYLDRRNRYGSFS